MMPESPTKLAESPTKRRASSPTKKVSIIAQAKHRPESPSKRGRSPVKVDSKPEVREQARKVLEKFLKRSLSQNDAVRGSNIRKFQKDSTELVSIREGKQQIPTDPTPSFDRRDSYVAAVSETNEKRSSNGSASSLTRVKAQSMTVTKYEQMRIRKHSNAVISRNLGDSLSHSETLESDFSPESGGASKPEDQKPEQDSSDDEGNVQKGRKKKSKFSKAKSRIQQSFLRKQRELRYRETKKEDVATNGPTITRKSPTPEQNDRQTPIPHSAPCHGTLTWEADTDDEQDSAAQKSVRANSSPDVFNRISRIEKKQKTSWWSWLRPNKKKSTKQERAKSKSVDALSDPSYSVRPFGDIQTSYPDRLSRGAVQIERTEEHHHHIHQNGETRTTSIIKRHSLRGRCSFRNTGSATNSASSIDRSGLRLPGLRVARPRSPGTSGTALISDVVDDGGNSPLDDVDYGPVPFHERTQEQKEEVYDKIADRLATIADSYTKDDSVKSPDGTAVSAPVDIPQSGAPQPAAISSLERNIAHALREKGDANQQAGEMMSQVIVDAAKKEGYKIFKNELKKQVNSEPNLQHMAILFDLTRGAVQLAGAGGALAGRIKEYSIRYFEDKLADWVIGQGGWDSMISEDDEMESEEVEFET